MPILVLLISAIVGFGVVLAQQMALGNAARQTARSLAVQSSYCGTGGAAGSSTSTMLTDEAKTNATTLFVTKKNVSVEIERAQTTPTEGYATAWSGTTVCSGDTAQPCVGSSTGDNVYVRLRYTSTLSLPFFQPSFNLSAIGAFRCEFQS
jgi:Flp pilus assembly protein TadG